jgi:N6-L-threonylcarbamoyladenine synthase
VDTHRLYGGVVPEIASRAHVEAITSLCRRALDEAGCAPRDLDAVAVTSHPGLIGALLVAVNFAKAFAAQNGLPLIPVDHIKGHIAASYLTEGGECPRPPFLALAVSGGHTALYAVEDYTRYRTVGTTRDDAIGEAFDKIGRLIGIPYPAGAGFDRLAAEGFLRATGESDARVAYRKFAKSEAYRSGEYNLPSPALEDGTADFSFSGLKTAAINLLHRFEQTGAAFDRAIFAAAYTYRAVEAVIRQVGRMFEKYPSRALVVAGGVAANSHLRARLFELCEKNGVSLYIPPMSLCGDNGVMVAAETHFAYAAGVRAGDDLNASAADGI